MRKGKPYLGGGRYIQVENAAGLAGQEMRRFGLSKALVIGGRTALSVALPRIEAGLREHRLACRVEPFAGHCTLSRCAVLKDKALQYGADAVIGVGGGKALDAAKVVANDLNLGCITVPTSAATCAAYAVLSVIYSDEGDVLYSTFHDREPLAVLADTDILVRHCPARMLASGVADSAAKYPEIAFSMDHAQDWEKAVLPAAALSLSRFNWDELRVKGAAAVQSARAGAVSADVEDVVCTAIALTGTVSSLVSGGRQIAIAHSVYDSICKHFKDAQRAFLHGEIVSVGIPLQMHVNGASAQEIAETRAFLAGTGVPTRLTDIGVDGSGENLGIIASYIHESMGITEGWMRERIASGLQQIV